MVGAVIAYLDTQIVVWLCGKQIDRLPAVAKAAIEECGLRISPMVLLELQYLYEIKRIRRAPQTLLKQLRTQIQLEVCDHPFPSVIESALFETWARDPFDRVIVAQATSNASSPLITSDAKIRRNYSQSVW